MEHRELQPQDSPLRRFIYRSARPDAQLPHPMRRRTDIARASDPASNSARPLVFKVFMCARPD